MWRAVLRGVAAHLAIVACAALIHGSPAPAANEMVYVPLLKAAADPTFIPNSDWRLLGSDRVLFSLLFGWMTHWMTLTQVCWVGRILSWGAAANACLRLGARLGVSTPWSVGVVCLWLTLGQSIISSSWMFGGFEAKCIAYVLLVHGVERLLAQRWTVGAALVGLAMSFHVAVGLLGGFCAALMILAATLITKELGRKGLLSAAAAALACSSIGWTGLLLYHADPATAADYAYAARQRMPFHMDPSTWGGVPLVTLTLMIATSLVMLRQAFRGMPVSVGLGAFIVGLTIEGAAGAVAALLGAWEVLMITPFRLTGLFVPLLFFFLVVKLFTSGAYRTAPSVVVILVMAVLFNADAYASVAKRVVARPDYEVRPDRDAACAWLKGHTPKSAVVLFDPADGTATFDSERASVILWKAFLTPKIAKFRRLIAATAGTDSPEDLADLSARYNALPCKAILAIARDNEASHVVSKAQYPLPRVFARGEYSVYEITRDAACSGAPGGG